jgi:hypothetical protein
LQNVDPDGKDFEESAVRRGTVELWWFDRISEGTVDD